MKKVEVRSRWARMLSRCEDEDNPQYNDYGGRGIRVCDEWHDFNKFYSWCIENKLESHLQVDRTDNDGPYEPSNCSVVTRKKNARNKRNTKYLTAFGETKSMSDWAEDSRCVVAYTSLAQRVSRGWPTEDAISKSKRSDTQGIPANAKYYEAFGERKTLRGWSHDSRCVVGFQTLSHRVNNSGWDIEKALTQHLGPQHGRQSSFDKKCGMIIP